MKQYLDLLQHVMDNGVTKEDRTGTGTKAVFGHQMRFNLADGFPLVTTKKTHLRSIIHELLWFLRGETNIKSLADENVSIWNDWPLEKYLLAQGIDPYDAKHPTKEQKKDFMAKVKESDDFAEEWGNLGPVYGKQWVDWEAKDGSSINQIQNVIDTIKNNPDSRRIIVSPWNVGDINEMALPPCHCFFQFVVLGGKLHCQLYMRSVDTGLGLPFNIASYALLTMMVAQCCDLELGDFVFTSGDTHIYTNHVEQITEQLTREPYPLPQMKINPNVKNIFDFKYEDFELMNYQCHPLIKMPVAV